MQEVTLFCANNGKKGTAKDKLFKHPSRRIGVLTFLLLLALVIPAFLLPSSEASSSQEWTANYGENGSRGSTGYSIIQISDGGYVMAGCEGTGINSRALLMRVNSTGNWIWKSLWWGHPNLGAAVAYSVAPIRDGNFILSGAIFNASGSNNWDAYLIKASILGGDLWRYPLPGGSGNNSGSDAIQTADGGYAVTGLYSGWVNSSRMDNRMFLVKTDSAGLTLWNKTYGADSNGDSLLQTSDGGFVIVGSTNSSGAGENDVYLVRTDSNGTLVWSKTYGGSLDDYGYSIVQTADGGYAIAGQTQTLGDGKSAGLYLLKTDSSGNMQWNQIFTGAGIAAGESLIQPSSGGYAIVGFTRPVGASYNSVYLVRTDSNGAMLWNKTFGGSYSNTGYSIIQNIDGEFAITGSEGTSADSTVGWLIVTADAPTASPTPSLTPTPTSSSTSKSSTTSHSTTQATSNPTLASISPSPSPSPPSNPETVQATGDGTTLNLSISGNITSSQMSPVTIATDKEAKTTTLSFNVTGQSGTTGLGNITVPKKGIPYGTAPIIYIDNQKCPSQGYTQDTSNFYIWYSTHFSTHELSIVFTTQAQTSPSQLPLTLLALIIITIILIPAIGAVALIFIRKKKQKC